MTLSMTTAALVAVLVAAVGLAVVRSTTAVLRWLAWVMVLAFAVVASLQPLPQWRERALAAPTVALAGVPAAGRRAAGELA